MVLRLSSRVVTGFPTAGWTHLRASDGPCSLHMNAFNKLPIIGAARRKFGRIASNAVRPESSPIVDWSHSIEEASTGPPPMCPDQTLRVRFRPLHHHLIGGNEAKLAVETVGVEGAQLYDPAGRCR